MGIAVDDGCDVRRCRLNAPNKQEILCQTARIVGQTTVGVDGAKVRGSTRRKDPSRLGRASSRCDLDIDSKRRHIRGNEKNRSTFAAHRFGEPSKMVNLRGSLGLAMIRSSSSTAACLCSRTILHGFSLIFRRIRGGSGKIDHVMQSISLF